MSARGFKSVFMVASCAGAALCCYMVSLRVASERAALDDVEQQIVMVEQDIRLLQTEIGTRGRLAQLERWNARVLALSAPSADQFLDGGFQLASLVNPQPRRAIEAPVVLASAPAPQPQPAPLVEGEPAAGGAGATPAAGLLTEASLKIAPRGKTAATAIAPTKKAGDKQAKLPAAPVTKPIRTAKVDPLAPLPAGGGKSSTARESGPTR